MLKVCFLLAVPVFNVRRILFAAISRTRRLVNTSIARSRLIYLYSRWLTDWARRDWWSIICRGGGGSLWETATKTQVARRRLHRAGRSISPAISRAGRGREPPQHFSLMSAAAINSFIKEAGHREWVEPAGEVSQTATVCRCVSVPLWESCVGVSFWGWTAET